VVFGEDENRDALIERINTTIPSLQEFYRLNTTPRETIVDEAFHALFFNRTTFSGISTAGPIGGAKQDKYKVGCRYNAKTLTNTIKRLSEFRDRVEVYSGDFEEFIINLPDDVFMYVDPPYYEKGDILYPERMSDSDHLRLHSTLTNQDRPYILSYDTHPFILDLYSDHTISAVETRYSVGVKKMMGKECLIIPREES
jgi:DNA adenine methylase